MNNALRADRVRLDNNRGRKLCHRAKVGTINRLREKVGWAEMNSVLDKSPLGDLGVSARVPFMLRMFCSKKYKRDCSVLFYSKLYAA